jgi:hypothetical protein
LRTLFVIGGSDTESHRSQKLSSPKSQREKEQAFEHLLQSTLRPKTKQNSRVDERNKTKSSRKKWNTVRGASPAVAQDTPLEKVVGS